MVQLVQIKNNEIIVSARALCKSLPYFLGTRVSRQTSQDLSWHKPFDEMANKVSFSGSCVIFHALLLWKTCGGTQADKPAAALHIAKFPRLCFERACSNTDDLLLYFSVNRSCAFLVRSPKLSPSEKRHGFEKAGLATIMSPCRLVYATAASFYYILHVITHRPH